MTESNPWDFGWTQLLTITGLITTITIAIAGFRTFGKWKREKIEEKRIDIAIEALALCYESKFIFDHIRSPMAYAAEWKDMPKGPGESDDTAGQRGTFYATLKRIEANKDFFERAWKLQVKCTALFGPELEGTFLLLQKARRTIEVSAGMLYRDPHPQNRTPENIKLWQKWEGNVWGHATEGEDEIANQLNEFKSKMESICRPIIDATYRGNKRSIGKTVSNLQLTAVSILMASGTAYILIGVVHSVLFSLFVSRTDCLAPRGLVAIFCNTGIGISHLVVTLGWPFYWWTKFSA
ncbi:MAG: hypothetical protein ACRC9K_02375 [Afipia sp.]